MQERVPEKGDNQVPFWFVLLRKFKSLFSYLWAHLPVLRHPALGIGECAIVMGTLEKRGKVKDTPVWYTPSMT